MGRSTQVGTLFEISRRKSHGCIRKRKILSEYNEKSECDRTNKHPLGGGKRRDLFGFEVSNKAMK